MATVVMHAVVSVDGYVADDNDDVGPLFEWYFNGDLELVDGGPFKVSPASVDPGRPGASSAVPGSPLSRRTGN